MSSKKKTKKTTPSVVNAKIKNTALKTKAKNWNLTFGLKKVEDGIAVTQEILPVGIGKLVYFLNPKSKQKKIIPGIVMSSEKKSTIVFILGQNYLVTTDHLITLFKSWSGDFKTDFIIELKLSKLLGQTLDVFGNSYGSDKTHFLNLPKPLNGVSDRINVWKPLITSIKVIDCLFPIGLGQRQLIIGDRYTGKTTIAVDSILCQKITKKRLMTNLNFLKLTKIKKKIYKNKEERREKIEERREKREEWREKREEWRVKREAWRKKTEERREKREDRR